MVCGTCGIQALTPHVKAVSIFNAIISLMSVILGICGCISYTLNYEYIKVAPWSTLDVNWSPTGETNPPVSNDMHNYMIGGIRGGVEYWTVPHTRPESKYIKAPLPYADCMDKSITTGDHTYRSFCEPCDKASVAVVTFCSFALIAAAVAFLSHILRYTCDSYWWKDFSIVAGIASVVFGGIGASLALPCDTAFREWAEAQFGVDGASAVYDSYFPAGFVREYEVRYGSGLKVVVASFCMMIVLTTFSWLVPVEGEEKEEPATGCCGSAVSENDHKLVVQEEGAAGAAGADGAVVDPNAAAKALLMGAAMGALSDELPKAPEMPKVDIELPKMPKMW